MSLTTDLRYCYSGLRKRVAKDSSSLSNVNGSTDNEVNQLIHTNYIWNSFYGDITSIYGVMLYRIIGSYSTLCS